MDDFDGLPVHVQNALKRAGITSAEQARAMGRDAISKIAGVGPLAIGRLFTAAAPQPRQHTLTTDELRRVKRWFDVLEETAPLRLNEADLRLAQKLDGWVG